MSTERDDWLAWRREGLGASDIPGILGLSPWASPWSVWADKSGIADEVEQTDAMSHGLWAEHAIIPWFEHETGLFVNQIQMRCEGREPWMRCTTDGWAWEGRGHSEGPHTAPIAVVECKATGDSPAKWEDEGIPTMYAAQATWQTIVTGIPAVKFAVLHVPFGRISFRIYDFTPDADDVAFVLEAARRFWQHVLTGIPPEADAHPATTAAIKHAYDVTDPDDIAWADDETDAIVASLRHAKADLKTTTDRVNELENRLKVRIGDCAELRYGDDVLATWKAQTAERIDTKALREAMPDVAAQFTNTTTSRVLRLKSPKGK